MTSTLPIAVTMGEPAGIGGEIALKAWQRRERSGLPPFFLIDNPDRLRQLAQRLGRSVDVAEIAAPSDCLDPSLSGLPVLSLDLSGAIEPGDPNPSHAQAVIRSIDMAVDLALTGQVKALVTNPIHKKVLYDAGFSFPGHTEYLAHNCAKAAPDSHSLMILSTEDLRVVPVTSHLSLRDAIAALSIETIVDKGCQLAEALITDFGFSRPRIAVSALNPHGGEDGALGQEENHIIAPAVETLQEKGVLASGPFPADTLFHDAARHEYDAVLCMFHDQALIPLKTLDFDRGVNSTHGLPIVRTSPDHGTALNIAGRGLASSLSLEAALHRAAFIADRRSAAQQAAE